MMQIEFAEHDNGVRWAFFPALASLGLRHGISTRLGGFSRGSLSSLNLGLKVGDLEENLSRNRQQFCQAVGVETERVVSSGQIHGFNVVCVDNSQAGQRISDTDGLITNTQGLPLLLFFADCVPLLIFDPVHQAIGLSHAGWKGTLHSIGPRTLAAMRAAFDTDPADCLVGIGPSIGPEDYEVDRPVVQEIRRHWDTIDVFCRPGRADHWLLDLWKWNSRQFIDAGVCEANISVAGVSTASNSKLFFSHRASGGTAGRFGVLMSL
jgi:polyphenol oxidase